MLFVRPVGIIPISCGYKKYLHQLTAINLEKASINQFGKT
jgi:hypothetical protein